MISIHHASAILAGMLLLSSTAYAQTTTQAVNETSKPSASPTADAAKTGPAPLVVYFESGSSSLNPHDKEVLDKASRAYNEGKPIVMILTGTSDRVGNAQKNLTLSQRRATIVLTGLLDRGIPADRFQVVAKGQTDLPVPTAQGVSEAQNRRVEITWR